MKKFISLILCLCVISSLISLPVFSVEEEPVEIYAYNMVFRDQDGKIITDMDGAEGVYAELDIGTLSGEREYAFSVLSYCNGVLTGIETVTGTAKETEDNIVTPLLAVDSEKAADTEVKGMVTIPDFEKLLVNAGTLGTAETGIEKILINEYEITVEDGVNDYSLTRYIKKENYPPVVRAFAKDTASSVSISSESDGSLIEYNIAVTNAEGEVEEYTVELTAYAVDSTSLVAVEFNGKALSGFDPAVAEYTYDIRADAKIPEVKAYAYDENAKVKITSAAEIPGSIVIDVENEDVSSEYTINLRPIKELTIANTYSDDNKIIGTANPTYGYQYVKNNGVIEAGSQTFMRSRRSNKDKLAGGVGSWDYVGYAMFSLGFSGSDIVLKGTSELTGIVKADGVYELYDSVHDKLKVKDDFAEFNDGRATLLSSMTISKSYNLKKTFEFPGEKLTVPENGNIVIALVKGDLSKTDSEYVAIDRAELTIRYVEGVEKSPLSMSDAPFDESILAKQEKDSTPVVAEIVPTVSKEWVNKGEDVLLKVTVIAEKPEGLKDEKLLVKLLNPGKTEDGEEPADEKYAYITQAYENEEGNAEAEFLFSGEAGEYTVSVSCEYSDVYKDVKSYIPGTAKMNSLVHSLENEEISGDELEELLSGSLTELAMDSNLYAKLNAKGRKKAASYVIENIEDFTVDGINAMLSEASAVKGINEGEEVSVMEACVEEACIKDIVSVNENYEDYVNLENKASLFEMMCLEELDSPEDVEKSLFGNLGALKIKNITSHGEITKIAEAYEEYIDEEIYSSYKSLSSDKRILANKYMTGNRSEIKSMSDVSPLMEKAVKYAKTSSGQSTGGGGGGGNRGGGGAGTIGLGNVTTEAPVISGVKLPFTDVNESYWGYNAIKELYFEKVISGKTAEKFFPEDKITRAEFAKLVVEALKLSGEGDVSAFSDVSESDWYYKYVSTAFANGVINGVSESSFAPGNNITRQDAAVMIMRASKLDAGETDGSFSDDAEISDYAKEAVYTLKNKKILSGYNGLFNPLNNLTRAEAAQLIHKLTELSKK